MHYGGKNLPKGRQRKQKHLQVILARGERITTFRIRPWLAGALVLLGVVFSTVYIAATGYLVLRDEALSASLSHQIKVRHAYEERIADLRRDIDRLNSRNLVNQQTVELEMRELIDRQTALDARQDMIAELSQAARQANIVPKPRRRPESTDAVPGDAGPGKQASLSQLNIRSGKADDDAAFATRRLAVIAKASDDLAQRQADYLESIADAIGDKATRLGAALAQAGMSPPKTAEDAATSGVGGPFVAYLGTEDDEFAQAAEAAMEGIKLYAHLSDMADSTPLARPLTDAPITSKFGRRIDPFLKRPAMHSGIDFRAPSGRKVKATADGVVTKAGKNGGYGNMVIIDHGNGLSTRFAHLSRILVKKGQKVATGDHIGKVGSTGRSTGPHLHYEVRRGGKAVNPRTFIAAGQDIADLL